nr:Translation machinery-associated protein 46 [Exophiala xenobiotica]
MPPKGKPADQPKKTKATVDDKTFGMKNKKGGAVKKQIAQLQAQAKSNKSPEEKRKEAEKEQRKKEKEAAEAAKAEAAELFKPVQVQKVPFGVDPKTVLCQFFKQGHCDKGKKCKFSHDLDAGKKMAKRDLYQDTREEEKEEKEKDTMDDWDEEKLRNVVKSKHGNPRTTTDKVCKYFIQAVEDGKYGWFWTCPNGGDKCMYRHSLPPGFVLKTREQRRAEKELMDKSPLKTLTLEDFLESERHKLTGTLTPVTPESFAKWKKERLDKKAAEDQARQAKEATGRAMFESGHWKDSEDEDSDDSEEDDDDDDDDDNKESFNLEAMRQETERIRQQKEEERLARANGEPVSDPHDDTNSNADDGQEGDDDTGDGSGESSGGQE